MLAAMRAVPPARGVENGAGGGGRRGRGSEKSGTGREGEDDEARSGEWEGDEAGASMLPFWQSQPSRPDSASCKTGFARGVYIWDCGCDLGESFAGGGEGARFGTARSNQEVPLRPLNLLGPWVPCCSKCRCMDRESVSEWVCG